MATNAQEITDRMTALITATSIGLILIQGGTQEDAIMVILSLIREIREREKTRGRDV